MKVSIDYAQLCVCSHPMLMHVFPGKCMYDGCWCRNWQLNVGKMKMKTPSKNDVIINAQDNKHRKYSKASPKRKERNNPWINSNANVVGMNGNRASNQNRKHVRNVNHIIG